MYRHRFHFQLRQNYERLSCAALVSVKQSDVSPRLEASSFEPYAGDNLVVLLQRVAISRFNHEYECEFVAVD